MENKVNLYQEELLDHYKYPRNKGKVELPNLSSGIYNASCGDSVILQGIVHEDRLVEVKFEGSGCVISQATASMVTESAKGKNLDELAAISTNDILKMVKIELGPMRLRCALLINEALKQGIENYKKDAQER